jgi:putative transposase
VDFENNAIKIPKIGWVNTKLHRHFDGKCKTATVSRTPSGKYFISILIDDGIKYPEKQDFDENTTVGIDVGIKDFAILSDGTKIVNPSSLKKSIKRLKVLNKRLSRKQKGSKNREKAKIEIAKIHERISNQRHDFQHKLSSRLISENQAIALESLNVNGMLKNHRLAQSISDASWSSFVSKLEYKAQWHGKIILRIGQFEPSTKICNVCGYCNKYLTLADRRWQCPKCGTYHDRDVNAANNIKKFALDKQAIIGT